MSEAEKSNGSHRGNNRDEGDVENEDRGANLIPSQPAVAAVAPVLPEFKNQVISAEYLEPRSGFDFGEKSDDESVTEIDELPDYKDQVRPQRVPNIRQMQIDKQQQPDYEASKSYFSTCADASKSHDSTCADAEAELVGLDYPTTISVSNDTSTEQEPQHTSDIVHASTAMVVEHDDEKRTVVETKRKTVFLVMVVLLILLISGAVVGGVCGTGICVGRRSNSVGDANPEIATVAPSINPTAAFIASYINNVSLAARFIRYPASATATAEEKALQWVIEEDAVTYSMSDAASRQRLVQRYALAAVWFNSGGESWSETAGWLASLMECTWYGVKCDTSHRLIALDLSANGLAGLLAPDLCLLEKMSDLQLSQNTLRGPMPSSIGNCRNLKYLNLDFNELSGTIPESMLQLSNLVNVSLYSNQLTGTIGSWWGSLASLEGLYLGYNDLLGTIPSTLGNCTSMTSFSVSYNNLSGSLPSSLSRWSNLRHVWLAFVAGIYLDALLFLSYCYSLIFAESSGASSISSMVPFQVYLAKRGIISRRRKSLLFGKIHFKTCSLLCSESLFSFRTTRSYFYFNYFSGSVPDGFCNRDNVILRADCISEVSCLCCHTCF